MIVKAFFFVFFVIFSLISIRDFSTKICYCTFIDIKKRILVVTIMAEKKPVCTLVLVRNKN